MPKSLADLVGAALAKVEEIAPEDARRYAKRDCRILIEYLAVEHGDALVVLPGWLGSTGATAEYGVARWVQLPRLTLKEALER